MEATSKVLSIIAYYLSEYDLDAVETLGYEDRMEIHFRCGVVINQEYISKQNRNHS